jgi:hypothetical protein
MVASAAPPNLDKRFWLESAYTGDVGLRAGAEGSGAERRETTI